jgi:hypothetical protein
MTTDRVVRCCCFFTAIVAPEAGAETRADEAYVFVYAPRVCPSPYRGWCARAAVRVFVELEDPL